MALRAAQSEIELLEERYERNPSNPALLRDLSAKYFSSGHFGERAQQIYERALEIMPGDARLSKALNMSVFLRQVRRFTVESAEPELIDQEGLQESIEIVKSFLAESPSSPDLFCALGDLHIARGQVLLAIGAYENAINLGLTDRQLILRSYEFASQFHPIQPTERAYFARLYSQLGFDEEAITLYRSVIREGFHDSATIDTLAHLIEKRMRQESTPNAQNNLLMELTELRLLQNHRDKAIEAFRRVRFPVNQNFGLVKRMAAIFIEKQDYRLAFEYLSKIPVDEENKALINRITVELEKIGELDTAVYLLQFINDNDLLIKEAQSLREKEMEVHTELAVAELNYTNGRYDQAMSNYARVLRLGYKDDIFVLSKIVELLPLLRRDHIEDLLFIGQHYLGKQDYYRAMQFYDLVIERRQNDLEAQARLREIYDLILGRNPNLPELRMRSGDLHMLQDNYDGAIAEYKRAAQFPETNVEATRRMAVACMKKQDYAAAHEAFSTIPATELDLENLYQLHLIFYSKSRFAESIALLRMIADVDETYRDVSSRLELLQSRFAEEQPSSQADPRMRELIGDVAVGRYRYMEKIGGGGMGVVHKVFDNKNQRPVAMKILREGLANSSRAIERFFREARIAATLNHPNIVNIFDYNINNQTHQSYISMEFIDGLSLRDLFEDFFMENPQPLARRHGEALYYLQQICDALEVTHSKGIIHRDIKPDNILIGTDRVARLTDFGIVHIEEATFTPTGAVIGTPRYMSPEQVQGIRLDGRADLYSVGIILYEWLLGMPPFVTGDIAYQQVNVKPSSPAQQNPEIPAETSDIAMKCLEKDPAERFQSAQDLKAALGAVYRKHYPKGILEESAPLGLTTEGDIDSVH